MPTLQQLGNQQVNEAVGGAVERHVPLILTVRSDDRWINLRSRAIAVQGEHIIVEAPTDDGSAAPYEFAPAEKVGVSFKLKHYKHLFSATVAGTEKIALADGAEAMALVLCCPTQMHRLQRRSYFRVDVPPNRIVRASIWLGGRDAEPAGTSSGQPVWSGQVTNLSAGGFQMRTSAQAVGTTEPNDIVGVRMVFGAAEQAIYLDAQFRHAEPEEQTCLMGFQFVGLALTPEGLATLRFISEKVREFHRPVPTAAGCQHG